MGSPARTAAMKAAQFPPERIELHPPIFLSIVAQASFEHDFGRFIENQFRRTRGTADAVHGVQSQDPHISVPGAQNFRLPFFEGNLFQRQSGGKANEPVRTRQQLDDRIDRSFQTAPDKGLAGPSLHGRIGISQRPRQHFRYGGTCFISH